MPPLEELLQNCLSTVPGNPVDYASRLVEQGYHTPEIILAARSAEVLSNDCNLPIGIARVIWRAANRATGGQHEAAPQHSSHAAQLINMVQSIMAPRGN